VDFSFYYTAALLVIMTVLLIKEWLEVELTMFCVLLLLIAARVITLEEAFAGFSNEAMLSVGLLYIVAGALENTGALNRVGNFVLGSDQGAVPLKLLRLTIPVTAASAFINNTPLVAMGIPVIRSWAEKNRYALSKFLIPLSYATILGGVCTLIGTSTNLVVQGLLIKNGLQGMTFFEISSVGVPVAIAGVLFMCLIGHFLLPDRKEPIVELGEKTREFVIELRVTGEYAQVTKTIEEAGLRHLTGLFLFQIEREGKIIAPARPDDRIYVGDRLFFTGLPKTILELQKTPGLQLTKDSHFDLKQYDSAEIKTYEAVISASSPLVGRNVRDSNFRSNYGAVIIAIHRNGERILKKIGDVVLRPGDTLLLLADNNFFRQWYHSADFYLISSTEPISSKPLWQARFSLAMLLSIVALTVLNLLPLIAAAGFAAFLLMVTRCITPQEVKNQIDWRVLIVIACAFGISSAVTKSGIAELLSHAILTCNQYWGIIGVLAGIYLITNIYTTFISNNAAAAILFPVALATARHLNTDVMPFAVTVAIAASFAFATPIGYQTNMMVYGPGGYRFMDFIRIGLPLQILTGMLAIVLLYAVYY
jgi:di/tricarboxylate transporter